MAPYTLGDQACGRGAGTMSDSIMSLELPSASRSGACIYLGGMKSSVMNDEAGRPWAFIRLISAFGTDFLNRYRT